MEKACIEVKERMCHIAAKQLDCDVSLLTFHGDGVHCQDGRFISRADIAQKSMAGCAVAAEATVSHTSPVSPPPVMAGMVELEVDLETGGVEVLQFTAVVDCGTAINPNLVRVQTEGGIVQGIGMALYENVTYSPEGRVLENSFMDYKIPSRLDIGKLQVEIESSYEPTGPYGAKSVGEVVINTSAPAVAHAIFRATGVWHRELPITPEKILMSLQKNKQ